MGTKSNAKMGGLKSGHGDESYTMNARLESWFCLVHVWNCSHSPLQIKNPTQEPFSMSDTHYPISTIIVYSEVTEVRVCAKLRQMLVNHRWDTPSAGTVRFRDPCTFSLYLAIS